MHFIGGENVLKRRDVKVRYVSVCVGHSKFTFCRNRLNNIVSFTEIGLGNVWNYVVFYVDVCKPSKVANLLGFWWFRFWAGIQLKRTIRIQH